MKNNIYSLGKSQGQPIIGYIGYVRDGNGDFRIAGLQRAQKSRKVAGTLRLSVCVLYTALLFVDHELSPSVFGPGFLVMALHSGFFLAVADDGKPVRLNTQGDQVLQG